MFLITLQRKKEYDSVQKPPNAKTGRVYKTEPSTIGELIVENESGEIIFACVTCENGGPSTDTPNQDKRIVAREYYLEWTDSSTNGATAKAYPKWKAKNGRNVAVWLKTKDLPSFASRRVLIHSGNDPQSTEGCILVNYVDNGNGTCSDSTRCVNDLFLLFEKYGIENFKLIIKEINEG